MTHSVTEITALATRAAVGAGLPHAQARSFGRMVPYHLALGHDPALLGDLLTRAEANPSDSAALRLYLLVDRLRGALLSRGAATADPLSLELPLQRADAGLLPGYLCLTPGRITRLRVSAGHVRLTALAGAGPALPARVAPPQGLLDQMADLAWRTYVPASASSRSGGAGAGSIDND